MIISCFHDNSRKRIFQCHFKIPKSTIYVFQLVRGKQVGYLQNVVNFSLRQQRANQFSSPCWRFEPSSYAFEFPTLTNVLHCLRTWKKYFETILMAQASSIPCSVFLSFFVSNTIPLEVTKAYLSLFLEHLRFYNKIPKLLYGLFQETMSVGPF